jgi:hypothetical protein
MEPSSRSSRCYRCVILNTVLTTAVGDAICRIQTVPVGSRLERVAPAALRYHGKMPAMSITDALAINLASISAFRLS